MAIRRRRDRRREAPGRARDPRDRQARLDELRRRQTAIELSLYKQLLPTLHDALATLCLAMSMLGDALDATIVLRQQLRKLSRQL